MVVLIAFFAVNVFGVIASVTVSSFATRWLGTWLPAGWTTRWYSAARAEFQLDEVLLVTMEIVFIVVALSIAIGVPAAYALARRDFPGKRAVLLLFVLPLLVPSITYGIPLATVLYQARLAGTMNGVILANLVPTVPFVVRLDGTNDVEGRELLAQAALPNVHVEATMDAAAAKVVELAA